MCVLDIRTVVSELFLDARWTLGGLLRKVMRGTAGRPKKNEHQAGANFKAELARLNLNLNRAIEAQRKDKERAVPYFKPSPLPAPRVPPQ